jgi:hypothetical protein
MSHVYELEDNILNIPQGELQIQYNPIKIAKAFQLFQKWNR